VFHGIDVDAKPTQSQITRAQYFAHESRWVYVEAVIDADECCPM